MFCRVMFLRCCSLLVKSETVLWVLVRCVVSEPSLTNVLNSMIRWVRSLVQYRRRLFARTLCGGLPGSMWCSCF